MADKTIAIATPDLEITEGHVTTTSLQVAQHFGKRHDTVLRAIANLDCSPEFTARNFAASEYTDSTGRKLPAYRLTRDGFVFLAMGFTGKEAAAWKEAYLAAFNKMEQELLTRTTRTANPALDYERLSPSQKQDLKELVHAIAEAKVQSHGETWARLHNKFRVNSYHELPASQFAAARDYLLGKLPEAPAALPAPAPTLRNRRWLIATDHEGVETVQPIGPDDFVSSWPHLVAGVHNGNVLCTNAELLDMASACMQRLQQRSARAPLPALGR